MSTAKTCTHTYPDPPLQAWPSQRSLIVIDLEFTAWEGSHARGWNGEQEYREIIQIGAVEVVQHERTLALKAELDILVRPAINPELSDYITKLTGITNDMISERGVAFPAALRTLQEFTGAIDVVLCNGLDGQILRENCILNGVDYPFRPDRVANLRPLLAKTLELPEETVVSSRLPALVGLRNQRKTHFAVDDARAIVAAVNELLRMGRW